jgi:hypothetical protein
MIDNLSVDLKTVPEIHQTGVRNFIQDNPKIRGISSFVSRLLNNAIAIGIDRIEKQVPKSKLPTILLLDTFSTLKSEDVDLHPTRQGQMKIAELLLKRLYYYDQNAHIDIPIVEQNARQM